MADDQNPQNQNRQPASLLDQVEAELDKSAREALKGKLKELVKKRKEAEKQVALINLEITKAIDEYENGL